MSIIRWGDLPYRVALLQYDVYKNVNDNFGLLSQAHFLRTTSGSLVTEFRAFTGRPFVTGHLANGSETHFRLAFVIGGRRNYVAAQYTTGTLLQSGGNIELSTFVGPYTRGRAQRGHVLQIERSNA